MFDYRKYLTFSNLSIVLNVVLGIALYCTYKIASVKPDLSKVGDDSVLIQQMADRNQKSIDELDVKLQATELQRQKNLEEYRSTTQKILDSYATRIKDLEKKRTETVKKISDQYKGNLPGLAQEFSSATGIQLKDKP
jgi:hypothetical protein